MPKRRRRTEVLCKCCKKTFMKENREITRTQKKGRAHLCSIQCVSEYANPKTDGFGFYRNSCVRRARQKNLQYDVTTEFLRDLFYSQNGKCAVTGLKMTMNSRYIRGEQKSLFFASVDRIDNSKGYTKQNVHFVCLGFNYMRNTVSLDHAMEFFHSMRRLGMSEPNAL